MNGGSAQLEMSPEAAAGSTAEQASPGGALRRQAAERLAAHRQRRVRHGHAVGTVLEEGGEAATGRDRIAAAVAERYAHSPTYRAFLADQAQRAIDHAVAAAEVASRSAQAVAAVQGELLAELGKWTEPVQFNAQTAVVARPGLLTQATLSPASPHSPKSEQPVSTPRASAQSAPAAPLPVQELTTGGLTVRLFETLGRTSPPQTRSTVAAEDPTEALALEAEILFRQAPVFDDLIDFQASGAIEPLAANLVEFPRQLVAARKARPRVAEGPLRNDAPRNPQLRIFEVEAEQITREPAGVTLAPEWTSIRLGAQAAPQAPPVPDDVAAILPSLLAPQTAPVSRRLMAAAVDFVLVSAAWLSFVAVAARVSGSLTPGVPLLTAAAAAFALLLAGYLLLFFRFSDQTPGMRYARIGLCTFTDENPSRRAMRRRLLAVTVATVPLGLGLLWVWLDDDQLGWHDRISRMYQRAY